MVNGDSLNTDYHYGVSLDDVGIENNVGTHINAIGIWLGNSFYKLPTDSDWYSVAGFFTNYDIQFAPGTLTVNKQADPDYNWSYLYNDNPFDRIRNFRERKAEINFVDGGMEI